MKFFVAIKKDEYTQKFCFETEAERDEFIQVTKEMHPHVEFLLSQEEDSPLKRPFQAFTA